MRTALIVLGVLVVIVGGLLTLRSSTRAGMPEADILKRAQKRAEELRNRQDD